MLSAVFVLSGLSMFGDATKGMELLAEEEEEVKEVKEAAARREVEDGEEFEEDEKIWRATSSTMRVTTRIRQRYSWHVCCTRCFICDDKNWYKKIKLQFRSIC